LTVDNPANSPHVMGVGGTTPTCSAGMTPSSPACAGYRSETGWSGAGGGVSQVFTRPAFQTACRVPAGTQRLVPDVALAANPSPGNYVRKGGFWYIVGGTSVAAPQWAGFVALLNQKLGGSGVANPGARPYGLCGTSAFHDVPSRSNRHHMAGAGLHMVPGPGPPRGKNFLAPPSTATTTSSTTSTNKPCRGGSR